MAGHIGNKNATGGKLTQNFLNAFESVIKEDNINSKYPAIFHTDEELFTLTNDKLTDKEKICYATFKNWKAGNLENPLLKSFLALYKSALLKQKEILFKEMIDEPKVWQKWAWIIERKFSAWNLKNINESTNTNTNRNYNSDTELTDDEIKRLNNEFKEKY